jgi:hypothetical protein
MGITICPDCGKESEDTGACAECGGTLEGVVIEGQSRPLGWVIFALLMAGLVLTGIIVVQMCRA